MKTLKILLVVTCLFASPLFKANGQNDKLAKIFPASSPEQQGMSSSVLDSMMRFIQNTNQNIHHLTIIRNNHTVLDTDIYPYSSLYLHDIASVTKSITSLLIGISIDKKLIASEDEPVLGFFPEIKSGDKLLRALTIKDLLTMRSGFACNTDDGEKALHEMRASKDWVSFVFDLPMVARPGETFSYCSCNTYLLGEILVRSTKMTLHDFAKKYLFTPLQISSSRWLANEKGINHGWGDLFLYPADMDKIGQMVLDKGKWQGRQIVPEQWIEKSLETASRLPGDKGYGYGWWTNDKAGYYEAAGRGRQTISVIPSKKMVVTMLGGEFDAGTIGKYIFKSIKSDQSTPARPDDHIKLKNTIRALASAPPSRAEKINDRILRMLNHKTIVFEKNITEIDSMEFHTINGKGRVTFYKKGSPEEYPIVLSTNVYAMSFDKGLQLPVALQAATKNENELILHFNQLGRINNFYFHFLTDGNNISTVMEETSNPIKTAVASSFR